MHPLKIMNIDEHAGIITKVCSFAVNTQQFSNSVRFDSIQNCTQKSQNITPNYIILHFLLHT